MFVFRFIYFITLMWMSTAKYLHPPMHAAMAAPHTHTHTLPPLASSTKEYAAVNISRIQIK